MVGAGKPKRVVALHAVVTRQRIHHGLVEGMAHVQDARNVGRGQLNGKPGLGGVAAGLEVAAAFPDGVPARFNVGRLKAFGEFVGGGLTHDELSKNNMYGRDKNAFRPAENL